MKRVLLDHCVPAQLRALLTECRVSTARMMGWEELMNGQLIDAAEAAGFEVLITSDKNLRYQQNLTARRIAIIELPTNRLPRLRPAIGRINSAVAEAKTGSFSTI